MMTSSAFLLAVTIVISASSPSVLAISSMTNYDDWLLLQDSCAQWRFEDPDDPRFALHVSKSFDGQTYVGMSATTRSYWEKDYVAASKGNFTYPDAEPTPAWRFKNVLTGVVFGTEYDGNYRLYSLRPGTYSDSQFNAYFALAKPRYLKDKPGVYEIRDQSGRAVTRGLDNFGYAFPTDSFENYHQAMRFRPVCIVCFDGSQKCEVKSGTSTMFAKSLKWEYVHNNIAIGEDYTWTVGNVDNFVQANEAVKELNQEWSVEAKASKTFFGTVDAEISASYTLEMNNLLRQETINSLTTSNEASRTLTFGAECKAGAVYLWTAVQEVEGHWPGDWHSRVPSRSRIMCTKDYVPPACPFGTCADVIDVVALENCQRCCTNCHGEIVFCNSPEHMASGGCSQAQYEAPVCGKYNFCVGYEGRKAYCYGSNQGCMWGGNDCLSDSDCFKYIANSVKFTDGISLGCADTLPDHDWKHDICRFPSSKN